MTTSHKAPTATQADSGSPHSADVGTSKPARRSALKTLISRMGLVPFSGLYGLAALIVFFGFTEPDLFLTETNFKIVLVNSAVTGLLAVGMLVPLAAGQLDLSISSIAGFALVFVAWASTHTSMSIYLIAIAAIVFAGLFGLASGLLVALLRLDSLIVTLAMSSVALGVTEYLTKGNTLTARTTSSFTNIGLGAIGPVPILAVFLAAVALIVYFWLEHTPGGRFVLASGNNANAARLAGINVSKIQIATLLFSSLIAGLAGVLLIARVGSATDTSGQGYLLPVVAGLFLGSTQVKSRANVAGTIIAVYLLGTGVQGIQLHGNQPWVNEVFNGVVLLVALSIATLRGRQVRRQPD
jgi:ribose transport system permease protein